MNGVRLSENGPERNAFAPELAEDLLSSCPQLPAKVFLGLPGFQVSGFERIVILAQDSLKGTQ